MEYLVKSSSPDKRRTGCVIVGIFDRRAPSADAGIVEKASGGGLAGVMRRGDMDGKLGQTLILHDVPGTAADRVMLVGLGRESAFDESAFRKAVAASARALRATGAVEAVSYLTRLEIKGRDAHWSVQQAALVTQAEYYRFDDCRGEASKADLPTYKLERLVFDVPEKGGVAAGEAGLREALAIGAGQQLAKDLGNLPGNLCTPTYLAAAAKKLGGTGERAAVKVKVLEEADMKKLGMGSLLGVAQGSVRPARLAIMEWQGGKGKDAPIAFVGKGVVFDSGGVSIKPAAGMDEMKGDMGGAAAVTGLLHTLASRKAKVNVVGIVGLVENMVDGNAQRPGDIVTSMSGQTIEVLNTDAEGRLVLADALYYCNERFQPKFMVNLATLTGAIMVALGQSHAGLFSNDDTLAAQLFDAGQATGEKVWRMPLGAEYDKLIDTKNADMKNIGTRFGGAIIAAQFLKRFVGDTAWAHLDIAGTAMGTPASEYNQSWASGFGVRLLDRLVQDNFEG